MVITNAELEAFARTLERAPLTHAEAAFMNGILARMGQDAKRTEDAAQKRANAEQVKASAPAQEPDGTAHDAQAHQTSSTTPE